MQQIDTSLNRQRPWNDPSATPFLELQRLTKTFGSFEAVKNVSLKIYQGELFCLLGGSGCGKSTLLRMLSGFEEPTSGKILIDGEDQAGVPPHARETNMMFQSYALFPHMSVEKNIAYGLRREGVSRSDIATRVTEMLSLVQLDQLANRRPHQLSGGQRQRVALARALIKRPKLLLLDEPLGALDKKLREETQFELMNIQDELGVTFVVVTHDQEEAMTLSTRLAVMDAGELIQVGTPREVYEYPQNRLVAEFIGSVNLFEGHILGDGDETGTITSPSLPRDIFISHAITGVTGQEVTVAVRPEKIQISKDPLDLPNTAQGKVVEIAYMGGLSIFLVELETGMTIRVTQPNLVRAGQHMFDWDEAVYIGFDGSAGVVVSQ